MTESEVAEAIAGRLDGSTRPRRPGERLAAAADGDEAAVVLVDRGRPAQRFRVVVEDEGLIENGSR